jgi:hypothetical protein
MSRSRELGSELRYAPRGPRIREPEVIRSAGPQRRALSTALPVRDCIAGERRKRFVRSIVPMVAEASRLRTDANALCTMIRDPARRSALHELADCESA